jgi:hypothetical protein
MPDHARSSEGEREPGGIVWQSFFSSYTPIFSNHSINNEITQILFKLLYSFITFILTANGWLLRSVINY